MSDDPEQARDRARPTTGTDLIIPVASIVLVIYYFSTIWNSPWTAKVTAYVVGLTLAGLSLLFIGQKLVELFSGKARFSLRELIEPVGMLPQRLILFALTLGSLIFIPWLGFTLTSILFLSSATLLLTKGRGALRIVVVAVILSISWFVLFVLVFQRRFPLGWLDEQLKAFFLPMLKSIGLG